MQVIFYEIGIPRSTTVWHISSMSPADRVASRSDSRSQSQAGETIELPERAAVVGMDEEHEEHEEHEEDNQTDTHHSEHNSTPNSTSNTSNRQGGFRTWVTKPWRLLKAWWSSHVSIVVPLDGDVRDHLGTTLLCSCVCHSTSQALTNVCP